MKGSISFEFDNDETDNMSVEELARMVRRLLGAFKSWGEDVVATEILVDNLEVRGLDPEPLKKALQEAYPGHVWIQGRGGK